MMGLSNILCNYDFFTGEYNSKVTNYKIKVKENEVTNSKAVVNIEELSNNIMDQYANGNITPEEMSSQLLKLSEYSREINDLASNNNENISPFRTEFFSEDNINFINDYFTELNEGENNEIISNLLNKISTYMEEKKNDYKLNELLDLSESLENTIYSELLKKEELKYSLLKSVVGAKNNSYLKKYINFDENNHASYRNIKRSFKKTVSNSLNKNALTTIMYEAIYFMKNKNIEKRKKNNSVKVDWDVELPKWFEKGYVKLLDYVSKSRNEKFTTKEIRDSLNLNDNPYYITKALSSAIEVGLIKRVKRGHYEVITKPTKFNKKNEKISAIISNLGTLKNNFQAAYIEPLRDSIFTEKFKNYFSENNDSFNKAQEAAFDDSVLSLYVDENGTEITNTITDEEKNKLRKLMLQTSIKQAKNYYKTINDNGNIFNEFSNEFINNLNNYYSQDLSLFHGNIDELKAFNEMSNYYNELKTKILYSLFSFKNTRIATNLTNELLKNFRDTFIKISENPVRAIELFANKFRKYEKRIVQL